VNVTPEELAVIKAGAETALDAVHRGWPWPEIDNDLMIGAALKDVPALIAEVERLRGALLAIGDFIDASVDGFVAASVLRRTIDYGLRCHQENPPASTTPGLSG
jgi:hypothetical protein